MNSDAETKLAEVVLLTGPLADDNARGPDDTQQVRKCHGHILYRRQSW